MFNVDDTVLVRTDMVVHEQYGGITCLEMHLPKGYVIAEIESITPEGNYYLKERDLPLIYSEEMLIPYYDIGLGDEVTVRDDEYFAFGNECGGFTILDGHYTNRGRTFMVTYDGDTAFKLNDGSGLWYSRSMFKPEFHGSPLEFEGDINDLF